MSRCNIGKHRHLPDSYFDPRELALGIRIEMEHTNDRRVAKQIAKDHLVEYKNYYSALIKMEQQLKQGYA